MPCASVRNTPSIRDLVSPDPSVWSVGPSSWGYQSYAQPVGAKSMTEPEIQAWLTALAPSTKGKIGKIKELLRYAKWDGMTVEDQAICERCLIELESESNASVGGPDREGP